MARQPDPNAPQQTEPPNPTGEGTVTDTPTETNETQTVTEGTPTETTADSEAKEKTRATIPISIPVEMAEILKAAAEKEGITVAALARNHLAAAFNYTLPPLTRNRAKTFNTPEERKAHAAEKQRERYTTANALLAAIKAGALGNVDLAALVEQFGKKEAPKAEATPAVAEAVPA